MENQIKLVVFDKDGTLMELGSAVVKLADDLINEFSSRTGINVPKSEIKDAFGIVDDKIDMWLKSNNARAIVERLKLLPDGKELAAWTLGKMDHLANDNEITDIKIIPGVEETLKHLKDSGYQLAIVSADDTDSMNLFLEKYQLKDYLDLVVTSDSSPYYKPQKELLDFILTELNVSREETMMVGDTVMDVQLGQNGEVNKIVGVLSGSGDQQDLQNAHIVLNDVSELISSGILK